MEENYNKNFYAIIGENPSKGARFQSYGMHVLENLKLRKK